MIAPFHIWDVQGAFFHLREDHHWTEDEIFACLKFDPDALARAAMARDAALSQADAEEWVRTALVIFGHYEP